MLRVASGAIMLGNASSGKARGLAVSVKEHYDRDLADDFTLSAI